MVHLKLIILNSNHSIHGYVDKRKVFINKRQNNITGIILLWWPIIPSLCFGLIEQLDNRSLNRAHLTVHYPIKNIIKANTKNDIN